MKILLTHRYFSPDTSPYGVILSEIAEELAQAGHSVEVFTSQPSYGSNRIIVADNGKTGKVKVHRIRLFPETKRISLLRLLNAGIYCAALFMHTLRSRADIVTAATFPPVLAAWSASLAARICGSRFIYHIQDIHPEVSTYTGGRLGNGLPARILRALDNQTLRRSDAIVTLSDDMAQTLRTRGLGPLPVIVKNNPPLQTDSGSVSAPRDLEKADGKIRVIFAGNLGRFQNLPLMAEGVAHCFEKHPELELMFLGNGVALPDLKARWEGHPQVRFAPFLPYAQARRIIGNADIGLVSLKSNIYRVAYPSKVSTYLNLGLKILALVEPESQLARKLRDSGKGEVPHVPTVAGIGAALEALMLRKPEPVEHRDAGRRRIWPGLISGLATPEAAMPE